MKANSRIVLRVATVKRGILMEIHTLVSMILEKHTVEVSTTTPMVLFMLVILGRVRSMARESGREELLLVISMMESMHLI